MPPCLSFSLLFLFIFQKIDECDGCVGCVSIQASPYADQEVLSRLSLFSPVSFSLLPSILLFPSLLLLIASSFTRLIFILFILFLFLLNFAYLSKAEIAMLAVSINAQNRGVGAFLMNLAFEVSRKVFNRTKRGEGRIGRRMIVGEGRGGRRTRQERREDRGHSYYLTLSKGIWCKASRHHCGTLPRRHHSVVQEDGVCGHWREAAIPPLHDVTRGGWELYGFEKRPIGDVGR